jgi:hypothetical protein
MKTAASLLTLSLLFLAPLNPASASATPDTKAVAAATQMGTVDDEAKLIAQQIPSYPTMTCVVSGELMGGDMGEPIDVLHEGRLVRLCCKMCMKELEKDPAAVMAAVDAAIIAAQGPSYPLDTCPISGKELGAMGEPINHILGTRLVRLCCGGCVKGADKAPAATLEKVNKALIAAQIKTYPLSTCPVSGKELGAMGEPVDFLYGTRLIRLCCGGCVKGAAKNPQAALAKIDAAFAAAKPSDSAK